MEATLRAYQEPTTSGAMPSSTSTSNLHAADAPLPTGTLLENLGLGLVIVCTKVSCGCSYGSTALPMANRGYSNSQADQMSMLERDREFSEDLFDYVQQLIRTVALRCKLSFFFCGTAVVTELMTACAKTVPPCSTRPRPTRLPMPSCGNTSSTACSPQIRPHN